MEVITRRGSRSMEQAEFDQLRAQYTSTLLDLGTGDGAWPRRFAREQPRCLAVGVDADRQALKRAAQAAERKPQRGGAPNTLYLASNIQQPPPELAGAADWITIYFPWSQLLTMLLEGDEAVTTILNHLSRARTRLTLTLNAEAAPEPLAKPTPETLQRTLKQPLQAAGYRIVKSNWEETAPPTTWGGRLVKGSGRTMITLEAAR